MNDAVQQEIENELERAQTLKEKSDEFIDLAGGINNAERIRLEIERDIDIDSRRYVPLDDILYGEEVIRVEEELPALESAIHTLQSIAEGYVPAAEIVEKFQDAIEDLNRIEGTLEDVRAEDVIKASLEPYEYQDPYYDVEEEEEDE